MRVLILANFDVGLYQFRRELIEEFLKENEVYLSLPYGDLVLPLEEMGCKFIDTLFERRGTNIFRDKRLLINYFQIYRKIKPECVIT